MKSTDRQEELKSCPFCGYHAFMFDNGSLFKKYHVSCGKCSCRTIAYGTEAAARNIWNTRPDTELREALGEVVEFLNHKNVPTQYANVGYIKEYHISMKKLKSKLTKLLND